MDIATVVRLLMGFIILILLATSHLYIQKLERIGCACSEHPHRNYIKNFTAIAFVYILVMMFLPQNLLMQSSEGAYGIVFGVLSIAFLVAIVMFFIFSIKYVRYLVKEKCKCSEDTRREVLYYWSIAHLILMGIVTLIPLFLSIIGGGLALVMNTIKDVRAKHNNTYEVATNPFKNIKDVPKKLKADLKSLKDLTKVVRK